MSHRKPSWRNRSDSIIEFMSKYDFPNLSDGANQGVLMHGAEAFLHSNHLRGETHDMWLHYSEFSDGANIPQKNYSVRHVLDVPRMMK